MYFYNFNFSIELSSDFTDILKRKLGGRLRYY